MSRVLTAVCLSLAMCATLSAQTLPTGSRLKDLAGSTLIGAAFFADWYTDVDKAIVLREHNAVEAVCYGAYGGWNAPGSYDFTMFNNTINWAVANNKKVIMHVLVGNDIYMPAWMKNGSYSAAQLEQLIDDFMKAIIQSNSNNTKVDMWNVVNEACKGDGTGFETSVLNNMGMEADASGLTGSDRMVTQFPVYIRRAFEIARKYTTKDLELRDYGIEMEVTGYAPSLPKHKLFYQLCRHLIAKGAPITAVGLQAHLSFDPSWAANTWDDHGNWIRTLKALGLKVFVTENDMRPGITPIMAGWDEYQRGKVYDMMKAERLAGLNGFFTWGIRQNADPGGWLKGLDALPFFENGDPKPYYYGMQQALSETQNLTRVGSGPRACTADSRSRAMPVSTISFTTDGRRVQAAGRCGHRPPLGCRVLAANRAPATGLLRLTVSTSR